MDENTKNEWPSWIRAVNDFKSLIVIVCIAVVINRSPSSLSNIKGFFHPILI